MYNSLYCAIQEISLLVDCSSFEVMLFELHKFGFISYIDFVKLLDALNEQKDKIM